MLKHNVINNTNATSCVEDVSCSSVQSLQSEMSVGDSERRELMGKYAAYTLPVGDRIDVVVEGPFSVNKSHNFPQDIHDTNPPTGAK